MPRPGLLLCFDAFGTLFRPKPVVAQYADVARRCGLAAFSHDELAASLRAALAAETRRHPNYGRATGLGAARWWTNVRHLAPSTTGLLTKSKVIHATFTPLAAGAALPPDLAPRLLRRFASSEGYHAEPALVPALRALRRPPPSCLYDGVVVGVVTNSDDRVPAILASFGLDVSPMRYGDDADAAAHDIDFVCTSYDVGAEKPDARIFDAAASMSAAVVARRPGAGGAAAWHKVYVGDEHAKDVAGAAAAGWSPLLLDADGAAAPAVPSLEDCCAASIDELFAAHEVLRVPSVQRLVAWLTGRGAVE